ncbi:unnamed protein product [Rotaria sordida]|uniref:Aminopeptidase P N-terminal domain-containing protein n=1 Tax=Rotaria sordida TaxID=392033 RepID=A0A814IT23_9BILA|nr:unnamed protein product [Rotaria sordida]
MKSIIRQHHFYIDHYDISSTGISLNEFRQRRHSLVNLIRNYIKTEQKQSSKNFTICLPSSSRLYMGPDVAYFPFKQQSDFYYLTGCMQPDAVLLINGNDQTFSTNLFLSRCTMHSTDEYERWFGPIITDGEQISDIFGIDRVYPIDQLITLELPLSSILFYNSQFINDKTIHKKNLIPLLKRFSSSIVCNQLTKFLHSLRSIKSFAEQTLIRRVCQLTSIALIRTIKNCKKDVENEHLVKAQFQYECEKLGDISMAFHPVVAANGRGNVIHYQKNNQSINKDDLIMLDGGCLFKQYSSDMTRLWPINGRFSSPQQQLYDILLTVQKDLIRYLNSTDKIISREKLNTLADQYMIKYLCEENILSQTIDKHYAKNVMHILCPTGVSHHLGLDVHDCDLCTADQQLRSGNIITIEPGLYIPWSCKDVPSIYRGFAARLEDDVLLTEQGCEVLSNMCPKEIDDLYQILDDRDKSDMQ